MARLKEITIIGFDAWCKVYLYTVLEERENPERRLIRSIYGKTTHSINLTENEDTFIEKMEQTGICKLDNRAYDFITEDCGSWYVHICYDDKEIAIRGGHYIPEELREILRLMDIDLYRGPGRDQKNYHKMSDVERISGICSPKELISLLEE